MLDWAIMLIFELNVTLKTVIENYLNSLDFKNVFNLVALFERFHL